MSIACDSAGDELAGLEPWALREAVALMIAQATEGYSGAVIGNVCNEAAVAALREDIGAQWVEPRHFRDAVRQQASCSLLRGASI